MASTDDSGGLTRRQMLQRSAAAATVAAGTGYAGTNMMTRRADALACGGLCILGASAAAGAAVGWTLRETEVIGSDDTPEGLTGSALKNEIENTVQTRKSTNASTRVDNQNLLQAGEQAAYSKAKLAAIKALNNQETQSNVSDAGQSAVDEWESTVKRNMFQTWNESAKEVKSMYDAAKAHSNVDEQDTVYIDTNSSNGSGKKTTFSKNSHTLPDGSTIDVWRITGYDFSGSSGGYDPTYQWSDGFKMKIVAETTTEYMYYSDWNGLLNDITSLGDSVRNGIITWVDTVYSQVQSGEIDTADLLTPAELAQLSSKDKEGYNQAIADLLALNLPVDLERKAEIDLINSGTTLKGLLSVTSSVTLNQGDSVSPTTVSEDYYLTYDVSTQGGTWTAVNTAIDGGVVTFTTEPHEGVTYQIDTTAGETATAEYPDFTDNGDGTWSVDVTSQLETAITEVAEVSFFSQTAETKNVTVMLDEPFEIVSFTNTETGETTDSVTYQQQQQVETDSNYITQQEWDDREAKYNELIDKYEEEQTSGGGGLLGGFGLPLGLPGMALAAAAAAFLLGNN